VVVIVDDVVEDCVVEDAVVTGTVDELAVVFVEVEETVVVEFVVSWPILKVYCSALFAVLTSGI
jgi:hypothetical protein